MKILFLYNDTQTYTNTVYEHISAFQKYSNHQVYYAHQSENTPLNLNLEWFDAVVIHYTIRLPFNQISKSTKKLMASYSGVKALIIQDEYDHTYRTWEWIKDLGIKLVFTVVPEESVFKVYPQKEFPKVKFVSVLTGYVPGFINKHLHSIRPPSERELLIGYRGRPLPIKYGQLGKDKVEIGELVKRYCEDNDLPHDISWSEADRIYGADWYDFVSNCRAMLGTESGSNVFNWDGTLDKKIRNYRKRNNKSDDEIYIDLIEPFEIPGLMNQISPRVFESIIFKTVMVLFEGKYSGVIEPDRHFIALKSDASNLPAVIKQLKDKQFVDDMTQCAFDEIIGSGKFSYKNFVALFDQNMTEIFNENKFRSRITLEEVQLAVISQKLSRYPKRSGTPAKPSILDCLSIELVQNKQSMMQLLLQLLLRTVIALYMRTPIKIRLLIKPYCVSAYNLFNNFIRKPEPSSPPKSESEKE